MITEAMIEAMAMTINGPHDAKHIGAEKLKELQQVRWQGQTTEMDKNIRRAEARAVLEALMSEDGQVILQELSKKPVQGVLE